MKKLKLRVEELAVESFSAGDAREPRGTVQVNEALGTLPAACDYITSPPRCS